MNFILDILTIGASLIAVAFSGFVFNRQRKNQKFVGTRDFNLSWQAFNQLVVEDEDFQEFEKVLHPYGELTAAEIKRMYFYFLRFNNIYSVFSSTGEMHDPLAISALHTEANVSFKDQEFVRQHVFVRGYDAAFIRQVETLWKKIETTGKTLPAYGSATNRGAVPISINSRKITDFKKLDEKRTS